MKWNIRIKYYFSNKFDPNDQNFIRFCIKQIRIIQTLFILYQKELFVFL